MFPAKNSIHNDKNIVSSLHNKKLRKRLLKFNELFTLKSAKIKIHRTVNDWMQLGFIDGTKYPLPATVFIEKAIEKSIYTSPRNLEELVNQYDWQNAAVTNYDNETKLWTVRTLETRAREFYLPRIYIRFFAEDPNLFAERVVAAIKARKESEACIRSVANNANTRFSYTPFVKKSFRYFVPNEPCFSSVTHAFLFRFLIIDTICIWTA